MREKELSKYQILPCITWNIPGTYEVSLNVTKTVGLGPESVSTGCTPVLAVLLVPAERLPVQAVLGPLTYVLHYAF